MRGFAAQILLVVVLFILAGVAFLKYQTNQIKNVVSSAVTHATISTEKTYQDKDYGFQFKYQDKSKVIEDSEELYSKRNNGDARKNFAGYVGYQPPKLLKALSVISANLAPEQSPFSIWVFDNPNNLDPVSWYDNFWYYPFQWGVFNYPDKQNIQPDKQATVAGQIVSYNVVSYQDRKPKYVYLPIKGKMFLIRILAKDDSGEKILSTFKFTK